MAPAPLMVSQNAVDQFDHTDTCRGHCVLPLVDGQVSRSHLSTFLVLSSEYRMEVQASSVFSKVRDTHLMSRI